MSTVQLESLWQYIQSLNLNMTSRQWLADKLVEPNLNEAEDANPTTMEAIRESREGETTSFDSFTDFKKHIYEL